MRGWCWNVALAVVVVLSGCSSPDPPQAPAPEVIEADFEDLELSAATGLGVIQGVAVDASITPIEGVEVVLDAEATTVTDAKGRFGFSDVEPGLHTLRASRAGFTAVASTVDVVADEPDPRTTTLLLERIPGTEPYVMVLDWEGFMQCSVIAAGAFATGCLIAAYTDDDSRQLDPVEAEPTFLQSELVWTPTQTLGSNLCMRHYASAGGSDFEMLMDDACGSSPVVQSAGLEALNATGVGTERGIERVVWVAGYQGPETAGLALNQRFHVYTHLFYNFVPDPAWRFTTDGAPPVPPA